MEYRRRTFSNTLNNQLFDTEQQIPVSNSILIDKNLDEYTDYVYNGNFNICNIICRGFIKLMCPCCFRKRAISSVSNPRSL